MPRHRRDAHHRRVGPHLDVGFGADPGEHVGQCRSVEIAGAVVEQVGGRLIDVTIAYVTCDRSPPASALWTTYAITDVLPFNLKRLRALLRERRIGAIEIKKRRSPIEPEALRRQLRLDKDARNPATVIVTRVAGEPTVLFVERR